MGWTLPVGAQTLAQNPEGALLNPSVSKQSANWDLSDVTAASSMQVVPVRIGEAGEIKRALQLNVQGAAGLNAWDIALQRDFHVSVAQDQPLRLSFWAADLEIKVWL